MSEMLTRDEFYRSIADLKADNRENFAGINRRLDLLNGRTAKNEVTIEKHGWKIALLDRLARRRSGGAGATWAAAISSRERALIGVGFVFLAVMMEILRVMGTELWQLVTRTR